MTRTNDHSKTIFMSHTIIVLGLHEDYRGRERKRHTERDDDDILTIPRDKFHV